MRRLAITLMLCVMASGAQAANDRSSSFSCGIQFGSTRLTYSAQADTKSRQDYRTVNQRLQYVAGAVIKESPDFTPPRPPAFDATEQRLPPKFTFATLGCAWR